MFEMALHQLQEGDNGIVAANPCASGGGVRLAELGLTAGESVTVVRRGSPMVLQIGESRLCLRSDEAARVTVVCALA